MKLRTINQSVEFLREQDPGCALTPTAIRRKIVAGELPCIMAGNKYLVDVDTLEQHLFAPTSILLLGGWDMGPFSCHAEPARGGDRGEPLHHIGQRRLEGFPVQPG